MIKFLTKITASFLISLGFLFAMYGLSQLSSMGHDQTTYDQEEAGEATQDFYVSMGLAVPMVAGGTWMLWGLRQKNRQQLTENLNSTFYQMLKAGDGRITVLALAMEAQISGVEAKQYLDQKAKEFNANFQNSDTGDISYHFHL